MKQFKQKTLCYRVLAVLLMSSLSACGPLAMEGMSPLQGGLTLHDRGIAPPTTAGEFIAANGSEMEPQATVREVVAAAGSEMVRRPTTGGFVAANGSEMVQPPTTGEFVTVVGCAGARQGLATQTECRPVRWNPSTGKVAASIAIGSVWYYFAVLEPWAEAMQSIGDGNWNRSCWGVVAHSESVGDPNAAGHSRK
jgi:hypothetical protein